MQLPSPFRHPRLTIIETSLAAGFVPGPHLRTSADAARIFFDLIGESDRERFVALYLDARHRVTHAHLVSCGTVANAPIHPREVFKGALLANAVAIVVGHNHPSGDASPSPDDRSITERLRTVGELVGVEVLDSLIVTASGRYYAFAEEGIGVLRETSAVAETSMFTAPSFAYSCPGCGSTEVELCFPVWVPANAIDDRARWKLDHDAQPEKDSEKGWCPTCDVHVLVRREV